MPSLFNVCRLIRNAVKLYNTSVNSFELDSAEDAIATLKSCSVDFGKLASGNIFTRLIEKQTTHLVLVRKQQHIIQTISSILDESNRKGPLSAGQIDQLRVLIDDAHGIAFEHHWVFRAVEILKRLELARRSVTSIQSTEQLTSGQLEAAIAALDEYETLVHGAKDALASAKSRLDGIRREMAQYVPDLSRAIRRDSIEFNPADGSVRPSSEGASSLSTVLSEIDAGVLHSMECKGLYACCECFVECVKLTREQNTTAVIASLQVSFCAIHPIHPT